MTTRRAGLTFEGFMSMVDRHMNRLCGMGYRDLADYPYHDAYDDNRTALEVAQEVIRREME